MTNLMVLLLPNNQLTNLTLLAGLTNLVQIDLRGNKLASLTLPADLTRLSALLLGDNPLATFILSEAMADAKLAELVASLRDRGVSVFAYPLEVQLNLPRETATGAFEFALIGPPGLYKIFGSVGLAVWTELGVATNQFGSVLFTDVEVNGSPQKLYRTRQGVPVRVDADTLVKPTKSYRSDRR
jgi:Leucine-rich repeat (LRR) protein